MPRSGSCGRVHRRRQRQGFVFGLREWATVIAMAVLCMGLGVAAVLSFRATQPIGTVLRFALGWHRIADHQHQLTQALEAAWQGGEPAVARGQALPMPQRRGRERWQQHIYTLQVPARDSIASLETLLRQVAHRSRHTVLHRREWRQGPATGIELTLGIAGVPTDVFVVLLPPSPPPRPAARPQVAIVIDDLGWDLSAARDLLALDAPLSFAILPDAPYRLPIAQEARRRGREVLVHLPMEPHDYPSVNPGPYALLSRMRGEELTAKVRAALQEFPLAVGVNNHMGSRLTENRDAMHAVMGQLKHHSLFFLDSRTSPRSLAYETAQTMGVPTAQRHIFLDTVTETGEIRRQLSRLMAMASVQGSAIAIGHPYPETVHALQRMLPELRQSGIDVVPISRLVH